MTDAPLRRSSRTATKRATEEAAAPPIVTKKAKAAPKPKVEKEKKEPAAATTPVAAAEKKVKEKVVKEVKEKVVKEKEPEVNEGDVLPDDLPAVLTHDGVSTTLKELVEKSAKGVVIFAYPKASTPGCTIQACLFRDSTADFAAAGYAVYGLSGDAPSANLKFKEKQSLTDITMLCDQKYELHARLGIKKAPKGTIRSVVVITKEGEGEDKKAVVKARKPATPPKSLEEAKKTIGI